MGDKFDPIEVRRRQRARRASRRWKIAAAVWSALLATGVGVTAMYANCRSVPDRPATDAEIQAEMRKRGIADSQDWAEEFERRSKGTAPSR